MWQNGHLTLASSLKNKVEKVAPHYAAEPIFSLYKAGAGSRYYLLQIGLEFGAFGT